jgi:oxygen-independent coproporphyrinogen-3 oxidase
MGNPGPQRAGAPTSRELLRRWDSPVPRYTSYPPANRFSDAFGPQDYRELLAASAEAGGPLSLYVHLPFCAARCLFCGCNVAIARDPARADTYLDALEVEARAVAPLAAAGERGVGQLHWGGGTPTFLSARQLGRLAAILRDTFPLLPDAEVAVEVDPRHCCDDQLDALAAAGVNRVSLGVQDLDPAVQQAIRRVQPLDCVLATAAGARRRGIRQLSVDLIYGLPEQTLEGFARTLAAVVELRPDRVAVFGFAYLPSLLRHQRALHAAALPAPALRWDLLLAAAEALGAAGYVHVGLDHFALPADPLASAAAAGTLRRNFQGYTAGAPRDLVGLGASAIGELAGGYAQNCREVAHYLAAVGRSGLATARGLVPTAEQSLRRGLIHSLLCAGRIDVAAVEREHRLDFADTFARELAALQPMAADGLLVTSPEAITLTPVGRFLARSVAAAFDPEAPAGRSGHARAV